MKADDEAGEIDPEPDDAAPEDPGPDTSTADDADDVAGDDADRIGSEDIALLNGQAVARAGAFARLGGSALIVAGALGVAGWLWLTVRQLQVMDDLDGGDFGGPGPDISFVDRVDVVANYIPVLLYAAVPLGLGFALRLLADFTVARTGGSLTGFVVGDLVPPDDLDPVEVEPFG